MSTAADQSLAQQRHQAAVGSGRIAFHHRLALLLRGDEADDLRFLLHLPHDLADLVLRQLGLGETDAIELASHIQRSLDQRGLVGAEEFGDVVRRRLRGKAHDGKGALAGALASDGPLGAPSLTTIAAITAACSRIATAAAVADQASARGVRLERNSEMRPAKSNERWRRGERASSASIAANSLSIARAEGAPSVSLRWIVSASSSRTRS